MFKKNGCQFLHKRCCRHSLFNCRTTHMRQFKPCGHAFTRDALQCVKTIHVLCVEHVLILSLNNNSDQWTPFKYSWTHGVTDFEDTVCDLRILLNSLPTSKCVIVACRWIHSSFWRSRNIRTMSHAHEVHNCLQHHVQGTCGLKESMSSPFSISSITNHMSPAR